MTQKELDAIPENGGISYREEMQQGKRVLIPFMQPCKAMYQSQYVPMMVTDSQGVSWLIGYIDGVLHKSRLRGA